MWQDPIVQDIRKAGEELVKQANYDLHTFFENLRNNEKKRRVKVLSRSKEELPQKNFNSGAQYKNE